MEDWRHVIVSDWTDQSVTAHYPMHVLGKHKPREQERGDTCGLIFLTSTEHTLPKWLCINRSVGNTPKLYNCARAGAPAYAERSLRWLMCGRLHRNNCIISQLHAASPSRSYRAKFPDGLHVTDHRLSRHYLLYSSSSSSIRSHIGEFTALQWDTE